ncbi:MAG: hypothetical protein DRI89_11315 [Bacteroidetes bacterium]|nr:MAG: hypothetical protein DRI89_11315 [Bacteroidota bacterium]
MKRIILLIIFTLPFLVTNAQETVSGVSKSGYVNITKDPPKPPYLEITSLRFLDADDNKKIDASEKAVIYFDLHNSGLGPGLNLKVSVQELNHMTYLNFNKLTNIGTLDVGKTKQIQVPVESGMDLQTGRALFKIKIEEANGNDSDPVEIEVETMAFRAPKVQVVDNKVSSKNSNRLERRRPFDVQVLIQNVGEGAATTVGVKLQIPDGIFCLSGNENEMIANLGSGEQYLMEYELYANNEYESSTISLNIRLTEKHGKYAFDKKITLTMNQGVSSEKMVVQGKTESTQAIAVASLSSKVDKNIPYNPNKDPNRIALVIGNEDYSRTLNAEVDVDYARNDAEVFRQYAINVLGVEEKNMHFMLDATAGQMQREIDLVAAILQKLGDKGELIFYYAGHGFPDEATKTPYIIPVDVDATNLSSAIKLSEVYQKFGNTGAARVTVFLDACFSGGGRNQGLLAARGVSIKPKNEVINGNMVVFSATTGEQSALPYNTEGHGMFTYFLLDKIQQTGGQVSYGELSDYLKDKVGIESLRENGKPQDPEVNVSYTVENTWKMWKFR